MHMPTFVRMDQFSERNLVLTLADLGEYVHSRLHTRGFEDLRNGRRPRFSIGGAVRSCRHCFEGSHDRSNVITILRQIMKVYRELRIREGK
jgi:hypothetical protein